MKVDHKIFSDFSSGFAYSNYPFLEPSSKENIHILQCLV